MRRRDFCRSLLPLFATLSARAQNVVEDSSSEVFERSVLADDDLAALLDVEPKPWKPLPDGVAAPLRAKLDTLVSEAVAGWPWRPFFHQLGISGSETHFDHPDEHFAALASAIPFLPPGTAEKTRRFLAEQLRVLPPFSVAGYDRTAGAARERYTVPEELRAKGQGTARDAWGVHGMLCYYLATADKDAVAAHWPAIRARLEPLLKQPYAFDPRKLDYAHDEAERLNGDSAGLCAGLHLARLAGDDAAANAIRPRAAQLLQLRLDLERVNPRFLNKTDVSTKGLHHFKLARYLHLAEPALTLLRQDGTAARRLRSFRDARLGWWMAFGDRLIGGENYTTSPDFSRALFVAAVELEVTPPDILAGWLDIPWCRADWYQIGKISLTLQKQIQ